MCVPVRFVSLYLCFPNFHDTAAQARALELGREKRMDSRSSSSRRPIPVRRQLILFELFSLGIVLTLSFSNVGRIIKVSFRGRTVRWRLRVPTAVTSGFAEGLAAAMCVHLRAPMRVGAACATSSGGAPL